MTGEKRHDANARQVDMPVLSETDFIALAKLIKSETGIDMPSQKRALMQSRLARRLKILSKPNFSEYRSFIESSAGLEERVHLISAITTNVTKFFRENQHFEEIEAQILPKLVNRAKKGERIRIWSAGCSTGEEPYSLAMTIFNACPDAAHLDIKILATDIDPKVVAVGHNGIYPLSKVAHLPKGDTNRYFSHVEDSSNLLRIGKNLRDIISFRVLNLLDPWPFQGPFDIIMCRNVVIYFDAATQAKLWPRFADMLCPTGHLFIGHSERLSPDGAQLFHPTGATSFRKQSRADARKSSRRERPCVEEGQI